jgi:Rieske Fe-S protein
MKQPDAEKNAAEHKEGHNGGGLGPQAEIPQWAQDFPINSDQDNYVARRDFTKFMVLTSFAFVVGQCWIGIQNILRGRRGKPEERAIARIGETIGNSSAASALPLIGVGSTVPFVYPDEHDTCLLVRRGENDFVAYGQKCTHLSCAVTPSIEEGRFLCPCHEGCFDMATGRPLSGPPRRPLPLIKLSVRNGTVYATGVEERTV